jgi:glycosyltransferase involved in cell wall biosynthesis
MSSLPLISIVIPSFNQAPFLGECLRSVLGQPYPKLEVIVMDGGSTDGSAALLRRYSGMLACWTNEKDRGQADAVNRGWARAKGEVLGWLNSDDRYRPGALPMVADGWMRNPMAAMLYGDIAEIRGDGAAAGFKDMSGFGIRSLLLGKNMGQPGVFVTRRAYAAIGGLDESLHYALDFDYFLRVWLAFPAEDFVHIPDVLADSRLWTGTKSAGQAGKFGAEYRSVLDRFFARTDLPSEIRGLRRQAYSRSVHLRQARLSLDAGDWRRGIPALVRAMWTERSPWQAARMIHLAISIWRGRKSHAG